MKPFNVQTENVETPAALTGRPADSTRFHDWAEHRLSNYRQAMRDPIVSIRNPRHLSSSERTALLQKVLNLNLVVYECRARDVTRDDLRILGAELGLTRLDKNLMADSESISSISVSEAGTTEHYIPYTDHPLGWHTDGYYNQNARTIRSFILHCVNPAPRGGANAFLDPEVVYLLIRRQSDEFATSLTRGDVFSVPPNIRDGATLRPAFTGPVFSITPNTGRIHMRFTNRSQHIYWNPDPAVSRAVEFLKATIDRAESFKIRLKLQAGQGVICNNVLHSRSAFTNGESIEHQRLMYRARYYDRVADT